MKGECLLKIHVVQKGDTLWKIADLYNIDFEELKAANVHIASPDMIMPGMKIKIPTDDKQVKQVDKQAKNDKKVVKKSTRSKDPQDEKQEDPSINLEKNIRLQQNPLPSPIQMPKLTLSKKEKKAQKKQPKYNQQQKKPHAMKHPQASLAKMTSPSKHSHSQTMPLYSFPVPYCPVCGQESQFMMPYYYPFNAPTMYMPGSNFYGVPFPYMNAYQPVQEPYRK